MGWTASTSPGHERHRTGAVEATRTYDRQIEQIRGKLRELAILVSATQPDLEPERVTVQLEVGTDGYVHRWALAEPASHHIVSITRDLLHLGEPYPFVPGAVEVKVQLGAR